MLSNFNSYLILRSTGWNYDVEGYTVKGIIERIGWNDSGYEYGIIKIPERTTYYFDGRNLDEGTMSNLYEDDEVEFTPAKNPWNNNLIAKNVKRIVLLPKDAKKIESNLITMKATESETYILPEQETSNKSRWYTHGRSDKLMIRGFTKDEEAILYKLVSVLYHTNAGHFKTERNKLLYGYSLFGPTKQFVIQLGLEKVEFAVIFCNQEDFQRRTLEEAFSHLTRNVIPKVRVIGHFYMLVTKYDDIVSEIKKPDIQRSIEHSIVPFSYRELHDADAAELENFMLLRFKQFLFERDFFSYSEPINDRLFLFGGRDQYAKGIVDRSISGDHSGIFGLRKSGKTSVLNAIKQELDKRNIFYISYRCIELTIYGWYQALFRIAKDAYIKCEKELLIEEYTELNAMESFISDIDKLLRIQEFSQIVLIFDEIEQIAFDSTFGEKWQDSISFHYFWSTFITFCEKFNGKLSLIIAGINPSISEIDFLPVKDGKASPRNPMYKKLSNYNYLKPFVFEQIKRMVNELGKYMGLTFDDDVCFELYKDFGGHPFFTRQMCKVINQHIKDKNLRKEDEYLFAIKRPLYNAIKDGGIFEVESIQWCKDILKELKDCYSDEYQMLLKIANKDITAARQIKRNQSIIPHLLGYGLIRFDNASKEMDINIDIIRHYLISEKHYKRPFSEMTRSEIDLEIQNGIEECEQPLRNLIADVISTLYIPSDAEDFLKNTFSYRRDNSGKDLAGLNLRQLLDPSLVTLHFYVLKDIMCSSSKDKFGDHFEKFKVKLHPYTKKEIQSYLDNIYVARNPVDHHYLVFNEATLTNFRGSLLEIEKILKDRGYIL